MAETQKKNVNPNNSEFWFSDEELAEAGISRDSTNPEDAKILSAMIKAKEKTEREES